MIRLILVELHKRKEIIIAGVEKLDQTGGSMSCSETSNRRNIGQKLGKFEIDKIILDD